MTNLELGVRIIGRYQFALVSVQDAISPARRTNAERYLREALEQAAALLKVYEEDDEMKQVLGEMADYLEGLNMGRYNGTFGVGMPYYGTMANRVWANMR